MLSEGREWGRIGKGRRGKMCFAPCQRGEGKKRREPWDLPNMLLTSPKKDVKNIRKEERKRMRS